MERRDFLKGVGGLVVIASLASVTGSILTTRSWSSDDASGRALDYSSLTIDFTIPEGLAANIAAGPVMVAGIRLVSEGMQDKIRDFFSGTHLFNVDKVGAELIMLADGSRTLETIATEASAIISSPLDGAEVAEFFVTLGKTGYLQNQVYVALYENRV